MRQTVSIHAPAWGATCCRSRCAAQCWASFNPRTRVGCDLENAGLIRTYEVFQSTHPRGVRHPPPQGTRHPHAVSIHAPAWGATWKHSRPYRTRPVSIHAPAWGATSFKREFHRSFSVSIHAPAWGATIARPIPWPISLSFNPRTRVGCDLKRGTCTAEQYQFQSTHPRGVRHDMMRSWTPLASFNPRTRVGCDRDMARQPGDWLTVSIHAPAWGAT